MENKIIEKTKKLVEMLYEDREHFDDIYFLGNDEIKFTIKKDWKTINVWLFFIDLFLWKIEPYIEWRYKLNLYEIIEEFIDLKLKNLEKNKADEPF